MLKVAVIGTGFIGSVHAKNIARQPATELVAVCDVNLGSAVIAGQTEVLERDRAVQLELSHERDRLRLLLEVSESIAAHRNLNDLFEDLASAAL
jgi:predicted homoserine dehydrogenase-like protein